MLSSKQMGKKRERGHWKSQHLSSQMTNICDEASLSWKSPNTCLLKPLFSGNHQTPACWLVWTAINSKFFALLGFPYSPPPHWGGENYSMGLTCCCRLNCHMWWRQTAPLSVLLHRFDRAVQLSALVQTIGFTIKWWLNKVNLTHRHRHKTSRPLPCRICCIQHSHKRSTLCSIKTWHLLVLEKTFFVTFFCQRNLLYQ